MTLVYIEYLNNRCQHVIASHGSIDNSLHKFHSDEQIKT